MSLLSQIKRVLTGIVVPQEYCCLELEQLVSPLKVILSTKGSLTERDVTNTHILLGYKPVIIGLTATAEDPYLTDNDEVCLNFVAGSFTSNSNWNGFPSDSHAVAYMRLKKVQTKRLDGHITYIFVAEHAVHKLIGPLHQLVNNVREKFRIRSKDNVDLPGNLFDQVRVAYSVPRKISIITVSDDTLVNMFPTDLHGPIGSSYYAGSLRIGGSANAQVESLRRVVISDVDASSYLEVYSMGKNHMTDLQNERRFMLHPQRSNIFNFPLPEWALRCTEMIHLESLDIGIHRIHFYKIIHHQELENSGPTLAHIQQYYAQWRMDQGLRTTLNLRKG